MATWHDSSSPLVLEPGAPWRAAITLQIEPGTGNVQLQVLGSDGSTWTTPAGEDYTFDAVGIVRIERANTPDLKIVATGNAQFQVVAA